MKVAISATNPCHLFHLARELHQAGALDCYYSGYPRWKLDTAPGMPVRTHSFRTLVVYGALKLLPHWSGARRRHLFLWQDEAFDRWVGRVLTPADFIHAMPGQCAASFSTARRKGVRTVLNHATGPAREWVRTMAREYRRVGLDVEKVSAYDKEWLEQERREWELADHHCVASNLVRDQLVHCGIAPESIWVVPYGADPAVFHSRDRSQPDRFKITFAGQVGLRKGVHQLLSTLELAGSRDWEMHFFGAVLPEARSDLAAYRGRVPLSFHGPVSQPDLAEAFRRSSVLVLPSLEEGFGLVVPQALNCGLPCVVSDRTGAADIITHRENGSVVALNNPEALLGELCWWEGQQARPGECWDWREPARKLIQLQGEAS